MPSARTCSRYGLEIGEDNAMVWCQIGGRWELGKVEGRRGTGQRRKLVVTVEEVRARAVPSARVRRRRASLSIRRRVWSLLSRWRRRLSLPFS